MERIFIGGRGSGKTTGQIIMLMSEGNPGCMQFLAELMRTEGGQEAMLALAEYGILGSRAYQLWNDCCGRDTKKAVEILSLAKEKKITHEELCDHIDLPYGKPFDIEEIRKRDPKPEVMCHKLRVEMNPMMRGLPGMEKMQMDRMYSLLMERLFKNSDDIGKTFVVTAEKTMEAGHIYLKARKEEVRKHGKHETV